MKKLLICFLTLLLLCGCTSGGNTAQGEKSDYLTLLKNYEARKKTDNTVNDPDFEAFLDKVFKEGAAMDFLSMHYSVTDYKAMGLEKPEVNFGKISYDPSEDIAYYENQLKELQAFDYDKLSRKEQFDYEVLEYSLYETLADLDFTKYNLLFGQKSDFLSNIQTNINEYTFYDEESLDDFLIVLADADRYIDDCIAFTDAQVKDGIYMSDTDIDYAIDYIDNYVAKTADNEVIASFEKKLPELTFVSEEKKAEALAKVKEITVNELIPAYLRVKDKLNSYYGKLKESKALCDIDKEYAEFNIILNGSNSDAIDDIYNLLGQVWTEKYNGYIQAYYYSENAEAAQNYYGAGKVPYPLEGSALMNYLQTHSLKSFPDLGDIEYTVSPLDPSTASDNILAYYVSAPLDDLNLNIIRTNPNTLSADPFQTYSTVAHEGIPGHLYQHIYYYQHEPSLFRAIISFIGYTEGWAVKASEKALNYANFPYPEVATYAFFDNNFYFLFYSLMDIGINYYGWDLEAAKENAENMGINKDYAAEIYPFLKDMNGVYLNYGIGYASLETLENKAKEALGTAFDQLSYEDAILENGPLPFRLLEAVVDEYIANNK